MKAMAMTDFPEIGHVADELQMINVTVPRPKPDQVAIQLAASAMHIDEIYAAQGTDLGRFFGPKQVSVEEPYIMGSSVSGTVVGVASDVTDFKLGDEVIVVPNETGEIESWATYRCVTQSMVLPKPPSLTHVEAAALTMAACVAYGAVVFSANVKSGDKCLVIAASGGVGIMMVQFLHSMGAHVTAVCSGANAAMVQKYGAEQVIDYTEEDFSDAGPFDVVFDALGGKDTERRAFQCLEKSGRFVTVVGPVRQLGEEKLSWLQVIGMMAYIVRRVCVSWICIGPRYIFAANLPRKTIQPVLEQVVQHDIKMPVDQEIPFRATEIKAAVARLTTHRAKGRIVINFQLPAASNE